MNFVETMLPYAGQKLDSHIVSIDSAQMFYGLRQLHDPNSYMISVEIALLYAGQIVDSYIVSIDSAQIFCGLHKLHDPNCIWYPLKWCYRMLVRK